MLHSLSICLSDIPQDKITEGKNSKKYVNITVGDMRKPDQFGNDVNAWIQQSQEERTQKQDRTFVGSGKILAK